MLAVKTALKKAEEVKNYLMEHALLDKQYGAVKKENHIYFPILKKFKTKYEIVEIEGKKKVQQDTKQDLKKILTKEEIAKLKTSFDTVGTIAILEIPKELEAKEKIIAKYFLKHNIKTVLRKQAGHEGTFRIQKMKYLAGEDARTTIHKENGVLLKVDVEEVYFSVRLSEERKRINQQIKPNEEILVMFSGCAPYPIVFSKNSPAKHIVGIEINPVGHQLGLENIKLNKVKNVDLYCGDVKEVLPKIHVQFDRIVMPLPKTADDFLDISLQKAKKNATIHFYAFKQKDKFEETVAIIKDACKRNNKVCKILQIRKAGQQSPNVFRICVDFQVS